MAGFSKGVSAENLVKDDFGFIVPDNTPCKVATLLMNAYAATMLVHDFPHLNEKITKLSKANIVSETANGINYEYIYSIDINYINIKPIGRVVTGLLEYIKVVGSQSVRTEVRDFITKIVINNMVRNL